MSRVFTVDYCRELATGDTRLAHSHCAVETGTKLTWIRRTILGSVQLGFAQPGTPAGIAPPHPGVERAKLEARLDLEENRSRKSPIWSKAEYILVAFAFAFPRLHKKWFQPPIADLPDA